MITPLIRHADIVHPYTVRKNDLNGYGIMHGGRMLTLCDEIGYLAAHRHAGTPCLTRAVHRARFHHGIEKGAALEIHAKVGLVGNSSLWVPVEIRAEDSNIMMDAVFVFAAIGEHMRPQQIPPLPLIHEYDQKVHDMLECLRKQILTNP